MRKFIAGLILFAMTLQPYLAFSESRKELGIKDYHDCTTGTIYVDQKLRPIAIICDTNGDGSADFMESYLPGESRPVVIIQDSNHNRIIEPGEIFFSPKRDENWKRYFGRNDVDI
jgi:hypothetical protein